MSSISFLTRQNIKKESKMRYISNTKNKGWSTKDQYLQSYQSFDYFKPNKKYFQKYEKGSKIISDLPLVYFSPNDSRSLDLKYTNQKGFMRVNNMINHNYLKIIRGIDNQSSGNSLRESSSSGIPLLYQTITKKMPIYKRNENLNIIKQIKQRHFRFKNKLKQKQMNNIVQNSNRNSKDLIIQKIGRDQKCIMEYCNQNILSRSYVSGDGNNKGSNFSLDMGDIFLSKKKDKKRQNGMGGGKIVSLSGKKQSSRIMPWKIQQQNQELTI